MMWELSVDVIGFYGSLHKASDVGCGVLETYSVEKISLSRLVSRWRQCLPAHPAFQKMLVDQKQDHMMVTSYCLGMR